MSTQTDLLSALRQGNEQAYKTLFYSYFTDLVLYADRLLKDSTTAEDIVQEFFISFWLHKKYALIQTDLESYLYRSLHNTCLNYLRDEKRKQAHLAKAETETTVHPVLSSDAEENEREYQALYRALHHLPPQCKQIFMLCCLKEMTYQQTADYLGISINTVRTQMTRAFKSLRESLRGKTFSVLFLWFRQLQISDKAI